MTVTRIGTSKQYADNWDHVFGGRGRSSATQKTAAAAKPARQSAKKKPAKQASRKPLKKASRRK